MSNSKSAFLKFTPKPRKRVPIPETDGWFEVRQMTAAEVVEYGQRQALDRADSLAYLMIIATVDEDGNQAFSELDVDELKALPYERSSPLITAILEHNGLSKTDAQKKPDAVS